VDARIRRSEAAARASQSGESFTPQAAHDHAVRTKSMAGKSLIIGIADADIDDHSGK